MNIVFRGSSSFGRAIAFQAIGGGFEPRLPLKRFRIARTIGYSGQNKSRCSSVVEHFLGKEGVTSSTLVIGSDSFYLTDCKFNSLQLLTII